jgi:hypothetical protein
MVCNVVCNIVCNRDCNILAVAQHECNNNET